MDERRSIKAADHMPDGYMSQSQVAEYFNVTMQTILNWRTELGMPFELLHPTIDGKYSGRSWVIFNKEKVDQWAEQHGKQRKAAATKYKKRRRA